MPATRRHSMQRVSSAQPKPVFTRPGRCGRLALLRPAAEREGGACRRRRGDVVLPGPGAVGGRGLGVGRRGAAGHCEGRATRWRRRGVLPRACSARQDQSCDMGWVIGLSAYHPCRANTPAVRYSQHTAAHTPGESGARSSSGLPRMVYAGPEGDPGAPSGW